MAPESALRVASEDDAAPAAGLVVRGELRGFNRRTAVRKSDGQTFEFLSGAILCGRELLSVAFFDDAEAQRATGHPTDFDAGSLPLGRSGPLVEIAVYVRLTRDKDGNITGHELKARGYKRAAS